MNAHTPQQNGLLAALEADQRDRLFPHLEFVEMPLGHVVYSFGETMSHAWFPTDGIVSLLNVMQDGSSTEIGIVGNDGVVGISLFMGGGAMPGIGRVQIAGHAFRMDASRLQDEFHRDGKMQVILLRYTQALITQIAQTAVCNNHHSIEQRLCRWLLICLDRLPSNMIAMTHELMSGMLGVRRESVTEVAGRLQELGVIKYSRGHIEVLDRSRLEALSCECYAVVKREADRLWPPGASS